MGFVLTLPVIYLISVIVCADFHRFGPAYPTNQPFCSFLVSVGSHRPFPQVIFDWIPASLFFVFVGAILGWFYGKIRNRKLTATS